MSAQNYQLSFFVLLVSLLNKDSDWKIFYCHKFKVDKVDMVDIPRNIFSLTVTFLLAYLIIPTDASFSSLLP
jgi:hypothetical protein